MTTNISDLFTESLVLDTETTSLSFKDAEVIQYASADLMSVIEAIANETYQIPWSFYKPTEAITAKTSSITTITNRMVEGCPNFKDDKVQADIQNELNKYKYIIAHNAYYDIGVLEHHGLTLPKPICTMRMARKLFADHPEVEAHNLSYLRYLLLQESIPDTLPAHLADADVMVTGMLFVRMLEIAIERGILTDDADYGEQILNWLDAPIITEIMPFGKHQGKKLTQVPISYWQWALENFDSLDENDSAYDRDFAASVSDAIEQILQGAK